MQSVLTVTECEDPVTGEGDAKLQAVVELAQAMAAAHSPRESAHAAASGVRQALGGSFAAISKWERELGKLRVLVNVGELAEGEEEFPEDESYPVHEFPEIVGFLHEQWAGRRGAQRLGGDGRGGPCPARRDGGRPGRSLQPAAGGRPAPPRPGLLRGRADRAARPGVG